MIEVVNRGFLSMNRKICILGFILVSFLFGFLPVMSKDKSVTTSIKESKRLGYFIRRVSVKPDKFQWKNRTITVGDCWLEHPPRLGPYAGGRDKIVFTLNVDGNEYGEHELANKKNIHLELKQEDPKISLHTITFFLHLPPKQYWKSLWGAYGNYVHVIEFKEKCPKDFELKIIIGATMYHEQSDGTEIGKKEWSDTILTFSAEKVDSRSNP